MCTRKFVIALCIIGLSAVAFVIGFVTRSGDVGTQDRVQSFISAPTADTYGVIEQQDNSLKTNREAFIEKVLEGYADTYKEVSEVDDVSLPPDTQENIELIDQGVLQTTSTTSSVI